MNTTVTIHLANILFHIDSDAYTILKNYLSKLEKSFANTEGKREILEDIEIRIAELFSKYTHIENYVISINNINDVIQTLGTPEDISEESPTQENQECVLCRSHRQLIDIFTTSKKQKTVCL